MSQDNGDSSARGPGRPENPVDPASGPRALLAQGLKDLRKACGAPTLRVLATYAGTDYRRLGEAARDCGLPSWAIVESYVRGCWDYFEAQQHRPPPGAGNMEPWKQRYREAGGSVPEQPPEEPPLEDQPARQDSGRRQPGRLLAAAAAAVVLLVSGVLADVYVVGSDRSPGGHRDRVLGSTTYLGLRFSGPGRAPVPGGDRLRPHRICRLGPSRRRLGLCHRGHAPGNRLRLAGVPA